MISACGKNRILASLTVMVKFILAAKTVVLPVVPEIQLLGSYLPRRRTVSQLFHALTFNQFTDQHPCLPRSRTESVISHLTFYHSSDQKPCLTRKRTDSQLSNPWRSITLLINNLTRKRTFYHFTDQQPDKKKNRFTAIQSLAFYPFTDQQPDKKKNRFTAIQSLAFYHFTDQQPDKKKNRFTAIQSLAFYHNQQPDKKKKTDSQLSNPWRSILY